MNSDTLAQTYVNYKNSWFYVSTINRESSSQLSPGIYSETIVWTYNLESRKREDMIYQGGYVEDSIKHHQQIVNELFETGQIDEEKVYTQ